MRNLFFVLKKNTKNGENLKNHGVSNFAPDKISDQGTVIIFQGRQSTNGKPGTRVCTCYPVIPLIRAAPHDIIFKVPNVAAVLSSIAAVFSSIGAVLTSIDAILTLHGAFQPFRTH